jgi:hypothetical protein
MNDKIILTQEGTWVYKLNLPFNPPIYVYDYDIDRILFELNIAKRYFVETQRRKDNEN